MGMYWKSEASGRWWYEAPIETQALMAEAYNEILNDELLHLLYAERDVCV